ncbi:tetratricopeptide repeat protein [Devosia rhizoryzae]|uniref:Cellulose synthase n=1 Tax=Devosia rhizoryzae TaxID=2774137 RepID=A0ABX7C4E6_9HYPH|nr:cellulose synthase [Devosia rhizoryzae]QQR38627.1 cellulose synthase [Devosia rhizoryzae]
MRPLPYIVVFLAAAFAVYWVASAGAAPSVFDAAEPALLAQAAPAPQVQTSLDAPPAQTPPANAPVNSPPAPATPQAVVDETALRYFAQQGDTERLQQEIARLRALYPNWEPPADPLAEDYVPDAGIIAIWDLFNNGDFAGARAAIAEKQQADPSFVPSEDLLRSLTLGEAGERLRNASDAKAYDTVISIAANTPDLLTCDNVDFLWRLAEAFAQKDNASRAVDTYSYVLTNCTDTAERYSTMQKAIDLLDRADLDPLFALEKTDASGVAEFAGLRLDLARRSVAAALQEGGAQPPAEDVALFQAEVERSGSGEDLRLLGYYQLQRNRTNEARRLFERALEAEPSAQSAQALGVALLQLRDGKAAEAALAPYRDDSDELTALYLDAAAAYLATQPRVVIEEDILGRIVDTVMGARDANAAQELGWYAFNFDQPQTAVEWFSLALQWQADLEPAAYGKMVASNALGDTTTVESIRTQWAGRSTRIADFGRTAQTTTTTPAAATPPLPEPRPSRPQEALRQTKPVAEVRTVAAAAPPQNASSRSSGCAAYVPPMSLSPGAALNHAWCLMGLNRPAQAVDHFARALHSGSETTRSDAAYGQSLAFIRMGLPDEAAVAAAAAPLTDRRAIELETAILTQQATNAYNIGDYSRALDLLDRRALYAAERNDLLTLRAWSYYHLRRFNESKRIFQAVADTGYGDAVAGLQAASAALQASSN